MGTLGTWDIAIFISYLLLALGIGWWSRSRASESLDQFFVAGRSMPGWLIGVSMVATTFAADTPLVVSGIVNDKGIAGNWFWWSLALGHLLAAIVFAPLWRRATVITDAEFTELRYSGKPAVWLRGIRAFFFAVPINCIIMGWVIRAMGKVVSVLFPWDQWLPESTYAILVEHWPSWIAISTPSEGISLIIAVIFAGIYATMGGLSSVILTDLIQFVLAMIGSIGLAIVAVQHVGGLDGLTERLAVIYPESHTDILAYFPSGDSTWLPLHAFLTFIFVQWWAQKFADGGGILVQRMSAGKTPKDAITGTSFFVFAHYVLRPWPWIICGLVAMVAFPLSGSTADATLPGLDIVNNDREMAYPMLMRYLLPEGLLGILVTGMGAAFMSTIDTHINWGASYTVNDLYKRFINPQATQAQLVRASRFATVGILLLALIVTTQIATIENAWKFVTLIGSGMGLTSILRWVWWRMNAWGELAGIAGGALISLVYLSPWADAWNAMAYYQQLLIVVIFTTILTLVVVFLTPPESEETLTNFTLKVSPPGNWTTKRSAPPPPIVRLLGLWAASALALFGALFGIGEILLAPHPAVGWGLTAISLGLWIWIFRNVQREWQTDTPNL